MSSSRSVTFRRGVFTGWNLAVTGETVSGEPVRTIVQIQAPNDGRGGVLVFRPGVPGFDVSRDALYAGSGIESLEAVAQWVIDGTREALATRTDLDALHRDYWQGIVDAADVSRAVFYERYPDGVVPAFEIVGHIIAPAGSGLAALGRDQAKADAR